MFAKILNEDAVPIRKRRSDLPAGLDAVIDRGLQREPEQRFANTALLRQALESFRDTGR